MTTVKRFSTGSKVFKKGWYTLENPTGNQFYSFVYKASEIHNVSNCCLILKFFTKLPEGAEII